MDLARSFSSGRQRRRIEFCNRVIDGRVVPPQRGAALVTVLLAITLLTVVVVEFAYSAKVNYHLAYNALRTLQATSLARSGVNFATLILERDRGASGIDSLGENWARTLPPLPAGDGVVAVRVTDEQGKLNLNALRNTNGTINGLWREVTERLLQLQGVDPGLLDPLLDWLDGDDFPEPRGAEKTHYLGLTPPMLPRNGLLLTWGELGRVAGFTLAVRVRLDEVMTVLPDHNTRINVNTAPAEVLVALFPGADQDMLQQFLDTRAETPARGTGDLRERLGLALSVETLRFVSVRSEFFAIRALATVAPVSQALTVIVRRQAGEVTPLSWHPATPLAINREGRQ
ncbi:MAG: type II secretion system minor pseudopilin GspK [Candidatus Binatia bacterium]